MKYSQAITPLDGSLEGLSFVSQLDKKILLRLSVLNKHYKTEFM